ncbi:hypothetical protein M9Y10_034681 [Tritrichomonas musculus]|uniref:Uncharacterized protein n=1 Tax=Tritrichomonas musculus TaxID=1915356 RepID=A0ABR2KGQ9_9EUKA
MTMKATLPPIPNSVNSNSRDLGSFDPFAFRKQFSKGYQYTAYKEIANLSSSIESLQKENEMMRSELYDLVTTQDSPYFQMKRSILEFEARITEREKEAASVKKYYNGSSVSSTPTFVEVDIHKDKQASFDLVATSLLVCNEQRNFFKANDLRRQNEELLALIEHQQEALKMAQSRLHLYWQCQHQHSTQLMLDSLRRGISPPEIADAAPNQKTEQKMKIRILSDELKRLVAQRKELAESGAFQNRIKIQAKQKRNEKAVKIQKVIRGFLARLHSPLPRKSKPAMQEENQQFAVHEPPQGSSRPPRNNKMPEKADTNESHNDIPQNEENNNNNPTTSESIEETNNNNYNDNAVDNIQSNETPVVNEQDAGNADNNDNACDNIQSNETPVVDEQSAENADNNDNEVTNNDNNESNENAVVTNDDNNNGEKQADSVENQESSNN